MFAVVNSLISPILNIKKRIVHRRAVLDHPPPPIDTNNAWDYGAYSVKATVESIDKNGNVDRTFIGYSQNMDITARTKLACDRHKTPGTECGEPVMIIKGGECDEVIFMKTKNNGKLINLTNPFF